MKKLIMVLLVAMLSAGTAFAGSEWYCQGELLVYGAGGRDGKESRHSTTRQVRD